MPQQYLFGRKNLCSGCEVMVMPHRAQVQVEKLVLVILALLLAFAFFYFLFQLKGKLVP